MTITGKNARIFIIDNFGKENEYSVFIGEAIITLPSIVIANELCKAISIVEDKTMTGRIIIEQELSSSSFSFSSTIDSSELRKYLTNIQPVCPRTEGKPNKSYNKFLPKPYDFKRRK